MQLLRTFTQLVFLTGGVGASGYFLFRLRSVSWLPEPGEILSAPPEEAIYGAVWLLSVAVTVWVAFSTILSVFAYATRLPTAIRAVEWMTVPPIRRLARRSAALLMAIGSLSMAPVSGATELPPVPFLVTADQQVGSDTQPTEFAYETPKSIATPAPHRVREDTSDRPAQRINYETPTGIATPAPHRAGQGTSDRPAASVCYIVRPGDDMWSITDVYLTRQEDKPPSVARITEVWREVIDLNRNRIRSGNPDLIFPGEKLLLPQWPLTGDQLPVAGGQ